MAELPSTASSLDFDERRRTPRVEMLGLVHGEILRLATPVDVREVGLGGFSVRTAEPLELGAIHDFKLTVNAWSTVELRARVVHCRPNPDTSSLRGFVSGLEFVGRAPNDPSPAAELIDRITSVLSFE
jgi:hypothetical protein